VDKETLRESTRYSCIYSFIFLYRTYGTGEVTKKYYQKISIFRVKLKPIQ